MTVTSRICRGSASDGKGNAIYAPSAEGQRRCLLAAAEAEPGEGETLQEFGRRQTLAAGFLQLRQAQRAGLAA